MKIEIAAISAARKIEMSFLSIGMAHLKLLPPSSVHSTFRVLPTRSFPPLSDTAGAKIASRLAFEFALLPTPSTFRKFGHFLSCLSRKTFA